MNKTELIATIAKKTSLSAREARNVIDTLFEHADPDNWRLTPGSKAAPEIL